MARTKRGRLHEAGPKLFRRGRFYGADFRPYGGSRLSLRNPRDPGWPDFGERTDDPEEARKWVHDYIEYFRDEAKRRRSGKPKDWKLGEAIAAFEKYRVGKIEETTWSSNRAALKHLREWFGETTPVRRISAERLQGLFDQMQKRGYALSTLVTQRWTLSAFFEWTEIHNPAKRIELAQPDRFEDIYAWEDDDLERLRDVADDHDRRRRADPPRRMMLDLAVCTGARISELIALRWEDFDEPSWTVRIVRQMARGTTRPKGLKGNEARTAVVLEEWWAYQKDERGYILQDGQGNPLKLRYVEKLFGRLLDDAGLNGPGRGPKDARSTYSRLFLERGGWMDELQTSLGHKSITTTERSYAKFAARVRARFAVDRMRGGGRLRIVR